MAQEWYYAKRGRECGPVSPDRLRRLADSGVLWADDLVWTEGMSQWQPARKVRGLFVSPPTAERLGPPPLPPARPQPASPPDLPIVTADESATQTPSPDRATKVSQALMRVFVVLLVGLFRFWTQTTTGDGSSPRAPGGNAPASAPETMTPVIEAVDEPSGKTSAKTGKTRVVRTAMGLRPIKLEYPEYEIGLELSDIELDSTARVNFTAVWHPKPPWDTEHPETRKPFRDWKAYDSKGTVLTSGTLRFESIQSGEPTRGYIYLGYEHMKTMAVIKLE